MEKPIWTEKTVDIASLKPNPHNPRTITEEQFRKLKKSLAETGYHGRLLCDPNLNVLGGHMRLRALKELGVREIPVLVSSRELTEGEKLRISIQDNIEFGAWDIDLLSAQVDAEDLNYWGFPEKLLGTIEEVGTDDKPEAEEKDRALRVCPHCGGDISA